jgi:UV DNA damage repair endonuclease
MSVRKKNKDTKANENTNEGVDTMNANVGYAPLNLNLINNKQSKIVSSERALKDVTPISWSDDVVSGKKKVTLITKEK